MVLLKGISPNHSRVSYDGVVRDFEPLSPIASSTESNTSSTTHHAQQATAEEHKKSRDERLCKLFELEDEHCKDYFLCAYGPKNGWFLVQGLLYVFDRHIGFFSNLFGIETIKVIPLEDVDHISKTRNLGFPNSITVVFKDGRTNFFTSFLSRRAAFDSIQESLQAPQTIGDDHSESPSSDNTQRVRKTKVSIWGRHWEKASTAPRCSASGKLKRNRSIDGILNQRTLDQAEVLRAAVAEATGSTRGSRHRRSNSRGSIRRTRSKADINLEEWEDDVSLTPSAELDLQNSSQDIHDQTHHHQHQHQPQHLEPEQHAGDTGPPSPFASAAAQLKVLSTELDVEPRSPPEGSTLVLERTLHGVALQQLLEVLLSEDQEQSAFTRFHHMQGHRKATLGEAGWQPGGAMSEELHGWVRVFEFETKKLGKWTRCVQQHHCASYSDGTFIFASQQKMPDLSMFPMGKVGDQFCVETFWTMRDWVPHAPSPATSATLATHASAATTASSTVPGVHIQIHANVRFFSHASSALPKSVITSTAIAELKDWMPKYINFIQTLLPEAPASLADDLSLPRSSPILPSGGHRSHEAVSGPQDATTPKPSLPRHTASAPLSTPIKASALSSLTIPSTPAPPSSAASSPTPAPSHPAAALSSQSLSTASTALRTPLPPLWPADEAQLSTSGTHPTWQAPVPKSQNMSRTRSASRRLITRVKDASPVSKDGMLKLAGLLFCLVLMAINLLLLSAVSGLQIQVDRLEARLAS